MSLIPMVTRLPVVIAAAALTAGLQMPTAQAVPAAAGLASGAAGDAAGGLAVSLIEGIAKKLQGLSKPAVWCAVKISGPSEHEDAGHDNAAKTVGDAFDNWLGLEWELDADTGFVSAENHGSHKHGGFAELHYLYEDGAWRTNPILDKWSGERQEYYKGSWEIEAWANKDGDPDPGKDNITHAGALCMFKDDGPLADSDKDKWKKRGDFDDNAPILKSRRLSLNPDRVSPLPGSAGETVTTQAQAGLYFAPERFRFEDLGNQRVRVSPVGGPLFVDLFHTTAALDGRPALIPQNFAGVSGPMRGIVDDMLQQAETAAAGSALVSLDPDERAELTLVGAAVRLGVGEYDAFYADGSGKSDFDLLIEYFDDNAAVQIVAPSQAQTRYVPRVTCRETVIGDDKAACPNISEGLRKTLEPAPMTGGEQDLVGIVVAASGTLQEAVNLAADTPGSRIADRVDGLAAGEEFGLDLNYFQSSMGFAESIANNTICFAPEFDPQSEQYRDLCEEDREYILRPEPQPLPVYELPGAPQPTLPRQPGISLNFTGPVQSAPESSLLGLSD